MLSLQEIAARADLALFRPDATRADVDKVCSIAHERRVRAVCVPSAWVAQVAARLEDTDIKTVALVGFPLGNCEGDVKRFEAETAIDHGAQEIEFVLSAGKILEGDFRSLLREVRDLAEATEERPVCAVLPVGLLTREQIIQTCHLLLDSGAHAVASGTGFPGEAPPESEQVRWLREAVGPRFGLKGVIHAASVESAAACLEAGADRVGVSDFGLWEPRTVG